MQISVECLSYALETVMQISVEKIYYFWRSLAFQSLNKTCHKSTS